MAKYRGRNLYVVFGSTVLANQNHKFYTEFSYEFSGEAIEVSAGAVDSTEYITGLADRKMTLKGNWDSIGTGTLYACREQQIGTLTWGEIGTATGSPKGSAVALVTSLKVSEPYNDKVTFEMAFQLSGDLITDPRTGTW